ncbi:two-component system activity regulator YycH [Brevibacillus humidisoli]|uniref:YycH family regulatory protein n=1 Tax=Brevibacillus humidisoli TaxID=2895522 RepID=UPI001E5705FB|nr:two-component system activity regulator YycH [Brevibacillus humidisoli]UFJ40417.1 two-component system activity regulator YycH [Brevibacillus humidisoli]
MRRYKERIKSVVLNLLVLLSFVLTALLWNNQPQFEMIAPVTYVEPEPIGITRELDELIRPEEIVLHYGQNRHTKASPVDPQYTMVTSQMDKWYFYDFHQYVFPASKWRELMQDHVGMEIRYRASIPISVVQELFTFRGEMSRDVTEIDRLWLYLEESEDIVYALFISTEEKEVVRARTVVSPKDLRDSYLKLGNNLPEQFLKVMEAEMYEAPQLRTYWRIFYLPKESSVMRKYRYNYLPITEQALTDAFFLDPTLVRRIMERDGTIIYTDGSRSIQLRQEQPMFTFTDPALPERRGELTPAEKLHSAVGFINQHLGWTDPYYLEQIHERPGEGDVITFRQYMGAYPLVSDEGGSPEALTVTSDEGQVISLKRTLLDYDMYIDFEEFAVMSGPELFAYAREHEVDLSLVHHAYLAYRPNLYVGYIELTPVWVLENITGEKVLIDARSQQTEGSGQSGLE